MIRPSRRHQQPDVQCLRPSDATSAVRKLPCDRRVPRKSPGREQCQHLQQCGGHQPRWPINSDLKVKQTVTGEESGSDRARRLRFEWMDRPLPSTAKIERNDRLGYRASYRRDRLDPSTNGLEEPSLPIRICCGLPTLNAQAVSKPFFAVFPNHDPPVEPAAGRHHVRHLG